MLKTAPPAVNKSWTVSVQVVHLAVACVLQDGRFMKSIWIIIFIVSGCTASPLPDQKIPPNTLVMREFLQGPGPERTANWWGRFDLQGCWWEAHNTWLVVTDPGLSHSSAHPLHWNAQERPDPWFCLSDTQLAALREIVNRVPKRQSQTEYRSPTDRWTVRTERGFKVLSQPYGAHEEWSELRGFFRVLSSVSVWGQSPEEGHG